MTLKTRIFITLFKPQFSHYFKQKCLELATKWTSFESFHWRYILPHILHIYQSVIGFYHLHIGPLLIFMRINLIIILHIC